MGETICEGAEPSGRRRRLIGCPLNHESSSYKNDVPYNGPRTPKRLHSNNQKKSAIGGSTLSL